MKNIRSKKASIGAYGQGVIILNRHHTQLSRIIRSFSEYPKSMRMVEVQTNIMRPNICRYVKVLVKNGQIQKVKYSRCALTGRVVGYYTTNPRYFSHTIQLRMF